MASDFLAATEAFFWRTSSVSTMRIDMNTAKRSIPSAHFLGAVARRSCRTRITMGVSLALLGAPTFAQLTCVAANGNAQGASAAYATDTACGSNAVANGVGPQTGYATAFGYGATASYTGATAIGANAIAAYNNVDAECAC